MSFNFSRTKIIIISIVTFLIFGVVLWYLLSGEKTETVVPGDDSLPSVVVTPENNDDIRIGHLNLIEKMLVPAIARGFKLPLPEESLEVKFLDKTMVFQGMVPSSLYDSIGLKVLLDPVTQEPYRYALSADGVRYQFFARLDDVQRGNIQIDQAMVYSIGSPGLFFLNSKGRIVTPLQVDGESVDLAISSIRKKIGLDPFKNCLGIYNFKNIFVTTPKSGAYIIDIDGHDTKVFCDMQTDGGGWTLFYANNGHQDSPVAKSYVEMRESISTEPVSDLSDYNDPNMAGLLDFNSFIKLGSREILIRNRSGDIKKWIKFTFSTSRSLEWSLGPFILGKTIYGCIDLPRKDTWSIVNENGKLMYENLRQMMNHGGTSWGVSHEKYLCNDYKEGVNPHIGFYNANSNQSELRARSFDWLGGVLGDNEYRYFIR